MVVDFANFFVSDFDVPFLHANKVALDHSLVILLDFLVIAIGPDFLVNLKDVSPLKVVFHENRVLPYVSFAPKEDVVYLS